jgi:hypothetical protein
LLIYDKENNTYARVSVEEWAELCEISRLILSMFACNATGTAELGVEVCE